jgi:hypothetical protein
MLRQTLLATLAFAALAGPALGQTHLQWKFKEGDKFFLEEKMVSEIAVTALCQKFTEKQSSSRVSSFVVKTVNVDGIVMEQRIESWKTQSVGGFLGGMEDAGKLLEQVCKDVVFTLKMSRSGAITKFEGYDKMLKKISDINAAEAEQFKQLATEDVLRSPLDMAFDLLPEKAVSKGDKWRKNSELSIPALGKLTFATDFVHEGKGKGGDAISSKATITFQPSKGDLGMGVKLLKVALKKNEQVGKLTFDADKGRLVSRDLAMPLVGTFTVEAQGMQIDVELDGTETRSIRLHDKKPLPEI